jgi:signal transduction histidine kinase
MARQKNEDPEKGEVQSEALRQLRLGTAAERLAAARLLAEIGTPTELSALRGIRRRELDHYVQLGIDEAIEASRGRTPRVVVHAEPDDHLEDGPWDDAIYSQALRAVTISFAHELRRPLGLALLAAGRADFGSVVPYLERMQRLLKAMEKLVTLGDASEATQFDVSNLLRTLVAEHEDRFDVAINVIADADLRVNQDRDSVELIVCNALTNACESTIAAGGQDRRPIVVTCGITDREAWVGILDHGVGLPTGFDPFTFAASRKENHDGVGLALAQRAVLSIGGEIALIQRTDGGATFRLAFPTGSA